jgi:3',5'-cyclic AMP phosphodiesterase CpdA
MTPRLWALSDLHLRHARNREAVATLPSYPDDWLILAGDLGERDAELIELFERLAPRWAQIVWVPGNHELWTMPDQPLRGEARYHDLVALARRYGILTPEDAYPVFCSRPDGDVVLCPLFLLYDYSFAPPGLDPAAAVAWAREGGIVCMDELRLHPDPYPSRQAWCAARVADAESRLEALPPDTRTILVNHFPLRLDLCRLFRIPRFTPWCGTTATEDWHRRFRAELVISGHLHMRATDWRDGVRFEEVSLGYPTQWDSAAGAERYLRLVWPGPPAPAADAGPNWIR